jgi:hypothetical protein
VVERHLAKVDVAGSTPVSRSNEFHYASYLGSSLAGRSRVHEFNEEFKRFRKGRLLPVHSDGFRNPFRI